MTKEGRVLNYWGRMMQEMGAAAAGGDYNSFQCP